MRLLRVFLVHSYGLGLFMGLSALSSGCGGSSDTGGQMVVPATPPAEANKDSLDAYKRENLKGKTDKK